MRVPGLSHSRKKLSERLASNASLRARQGFHKTLEYTVYIVCAVLVGGVSVGIERLFEWATVRSHAWYEISPFLAFLVVPLSFWVAANLVSQFAPFAAGSGIPQVKRAVQNCRQKGANEKNFLELCSVRTAGVKVLSAMVALFGGASLGREGPMAQISAAIFQRVNLWARQFGHSFRFESVLSAGAAAGIAAAFNTPLGGITFALEELVEKGFGRVKQHVIFAIIVAGITAQSLAGNHLFFGRWVKVDLPQLWPSITSALFVGAVCGVCGVGFCHLVKQVKIRISALSVASRRHRVPLACGFLVALLGVVTQGHSFGTGYETTRTLLEEPGTFLNIWFPVVKFLSTLTSFASGAGGGIFAPSLAVGGATGNVLGYFFSPDFSVLYTVLGMTAWLAAITHAPLTAFVIVMEMTESHDAIIPMMMAAFSSFAVAKALMPQPLYSWLAEQLITRVPPR